MTQPVTLVTMAGVILFVTLAAPFRTGELLPLGPRVVYWGAMIVLTYGVGLGIDLALRHRIAGLDMVPRVLLAGLATAAGVVVVVVVLNLVTFGWLPDGREWPVFVGTVAALTVLTTAGFQTLSHHLNAAKTPVTSAAPPAPPALLDRLPLEKRGALVALSVEDHYVRIRTTKGEELILMRLSDAMRETGDVAGAQVHRSHWVAFDHVAQAERSGDRAILTLTDGTQIPVSRANLPKIKEAGLLPR